MDPNSFNQWGPMGAVVLMLAGAVTVLFRALMDSMNGRVADHKQHSSDLMSAVDTLKEARRVVEGRHGDR